MAQEVNPAHRLNLTDEQIQLINNTIRQGKVVELRVEHREIKVIAITRKCLNR